MGFTPEREVQWFLDQVPAVEKAIVDSGIILLKYWLEVSPQQQTKRLEGRVEDPRKVWKLSPMDVASYTKWDEYTAARDAMQQYLDRKYPAKPLFGDSAEEGAVIMRVCCEFQAYIEEHVMRVARAVLLRREDPNSDLVTNSMLVAAGVARTIEMRLSKGDWIVGDKPGAADYMIYPCIKLLLRALARPEARELSSRFMPVEANYPALAAWLKRVESLPGFDQTFPPHWR
jgi:glutathione S-transferase